MIRRSILITTDPGVFCSDIPSLSSAPGLHWFRHLTLGSHDPEHSRPGICFWWLLPPDTLCWSTIILISPSRPAVCPDRSLTFSILSGRFKGISRWHHDASGTLARGKLSRSCACSIIFLSTSPYEVYYKIAQTPLWRLPFIDSTTLNAQILHDVLISTYRCQTNSMN